MPEMSQAIARLTPLADVFIMLDGLANQVPPRDVAVTEAAGFTLAADVSGTLWPRRAAALYDGWAVAAADVADASGYAPAPLGKIPPRVETGDDMPPGTDAVLPPDAVTVRGASAEAIGSVAPGDGVLSVGGDSDPAKALFSAGRRLRNADIAVLSAGELTTVSVRAPRFAIAMAREDLRLLPAAQFIARDCAARGGVPTMRNGADITDVLAAKDADAVVIVGGTGAGGRDGSVTALGKAGRVACHGIGLTPGETAALGECNGKPVLVVPGRLDAAMAAWLVVGRRLLGRLAGHTEIETAATCRLARKVTSTVGMAEFVPVRREGDKAEPLAGRYLPLSALARATGYIVAPADSEGYAAGSEVAVHGWP